MRLKSSAVRILARSSDLARLQAYRVGDALKNLGHDVEFSFRASLGDLNQNDPLWKMPEKGVFTEDFLEDLRLGKADLVVHSWKDLPTENRPNTVIAATLPRADVRDLLLFREDRIERARAIGRVRVLTSSPRRAHNLREFLGAYLPFRSVVEFESVRGNIPTRVKKLFSQDVDALIVAKAAFDRLLEAPEAEFDEVRSVLRSALAKARFMVLPLSLNPTAAAQGALAIEISRDRKDLAEILSRIHCRDTASAVEQERRILSFHGGGCHQKIGISILNRPYGEISFLRGQTDAGEILDRVELTRVNSELLGSARDLSAVFPRENEKEFFSREALDRRVWARAEQERFLWVARESAWPEGFSVSPGAVVWTAGLRTWRKLSGRGVWVHGSAEGLGEVEPTRLENLLDQRQLNWLKLTHESSTAGAMRTCATYRLREKAGFPTLEGRSHFFWTSGSLFNLALKAAPSIRTAHHSCGPGQTHSHIRKALGDAAKVAVFLSLEDWRQAMASVAE